MTDLCHPETVRVAASHQAQAKKIAAEMVQRRGEVGLVGGGVVAARARPRVTASWVADVAPPPREAAPRSVETAS